MDSTTATTYEGRHRARAFSILDRVGFRRDRLAYLFGYDYVPRHSASHREVTRCGVEAIAAERQRQIDEEGYTAEHDAQHGALVLAKAASIYADKATGTDEWVGKPYPRLVGWPWRDEDFKPRDRRTALVKAGALIAAAIDQLDGEVSA